MRDSEILVAIIILVFALFVLVFGTRSSTINASIENCITANQDWTVTTATTYCNSIIREGKRP